MPSRRTVLAGGLAGGAAALLPASPSTAATYTPPAVRTRIDLNASWRFLRADASGAQAVSFDDSSWTAVTVPHTWNAADGQDGGNNYYRGPGWYRRHYAVPAAYAGRRMWLQFAGVNTTADVYVNGTLLGQHKGGYARIRFDATAALKPGQDNVIAVRVTNAADAGVPPLSADYTFFGGIYRNVSLQVTDPLCVRMLDNAGPGLFVRTTALSAASATVEVKSSGWNNGTTTRAVSVRAVVTDAAGNIVADATTAPQNVAAAAGFTTTQTITIANPHRWQGKADPYLYNANIEIRDGSTVTDAVTERFGLRTVTIDPVNGLFLNGVHVPLHGVNRHQDRLGRGWAINDPEHTTDFDLMDEMGVNALRTAHYQQDQKVYNLADERGYLVWAEIPLVNSVTNSAAFTANAQQQLRELIRQNYNHPSIVVWGIGNEQAADDSTTNNLLASLASLVSTEDPDRLSTYAHNGAITSGLVNHAKAAGYNRYSGWYSGASADFGPWADNLHAAQPTRLIAISEYGAGASVNQHQENPPKPVPDSDFHPEEYQALLHESHWAQIAARPYLWGTFVWNMFDFAADARSEGDTYGRNDKGLVTYDRATRKDAFYWYKANWTTTPFVYIASRRWASRTTAATTIKVYATADSVTLTLNGASLGTKTSSNHIYTWPATLRSGANTVTASGTRDGVAYTDTVTWTLA
ncbi:glycoside hydrolase family 2 protein [Hamadaea tsunoensis]|uniref:glycoside hydrolase family 2 protein n=1 Tax=Hamadaea tsunoensis TaxID=53368 RepID=UPI0004875870|nr:glycoside hydrolase family 2 TIM barrel-domain containing protein [Hamadaea tsunoensis]